MERTVTLEQAIGAALKTLRASLYLQWGGNVVAYHADTMTADVQPNPSDPRTNVDTGAVEPEPWPVLLNVPIAWPRFGGFVLVGPLSVGDPVTLEAFDVDPTTWLQQGRSIAPVAPADVRRLGGGYWKATPTDLTGPIADAAVAAAAVVLGIDGDPAQVQFSKGVLQLGKTGGDFLALANLVASELGKIKTALATLQVTVPSGGGTNIPVTASSPYTTVGNVASALIKAQ